jgi:hypothetical protein
MKLSKLDLMGIIGPVVGYLLFGWRGALLAFVIKAELTMNFDE